MARQITIQLDDNHPPEDTIREVARLVEEGYTSGYCPTWDILDDGE